MVFSSTTRGATPSWPFRIGAARWADQRRTREARRSPCTASFQRETSRLSQHSVAARLDDSNHLFRTFRHGAQGAYSRAFGDSKVRIASPLARSVIAVCVTEFLTVAVHALDKAGARFGDVRREDRTAFVVRAANEQIQAVNRIRRQGWGVRAFVDGAWGYASGTSQDADDVATAARRAAAIARGDARAGVPKIALRAMPSLRKTIRQKVKVEPSDVSGEEKIAAVMDLCRAQRIESISSTNASYSDSDWSFELANTSGARVSWREVRLRIAGQTIAAEGDRREAAYEFRDGTVGWELVKGMDLAEFGGGVAQEACEMLKAEKPPAGLRTVVTDPGVSGLLAHEVMGHASEADEIVKERSFLTHQVGKKVGSPLVTMYDDGTVPGAHGSIPFDAEGTPSHKTKVIDQGIYRGFLHSLETSGALKARRTSPGYAGIRG